MATLAVGLLVKVEDFEAFSKSFYDEHEGIVAEHDGQVNVLAAVASRRGTIRTAQAFVTSLRNAGVQVQGVDLTLVNTSDIADRVGKSRQYVRQLVLGTQGPGGFPAPIGHPGGVKVWDWGSANEWLRALGLGDEEQYLTYVEACALELWLHDPSVVVRSA